MENPETIAVDYRTLITETLQQNFRSVLIGIFTISLLFSLFYFQLSKATASGRTALSIFGVDDIPQSHEIESLSKKIQHSTFAKPTMTTQSSDSLSIVADNQGQISALSTQQVTVKTATYTVQEGDSISSIALKAYGDINAWPRIAQANKLANPENIEVGMVLTIPR